MPQAAVTAIALRRGKHRQEWQSLVWHSTGYAGGTLASLAHTRFAQGMGASNIRLSQRNPLVLTKNEREERTGSR